MLKAQAPTVHASNLSVTDKYCNTATISWDSGNGDGRIIFVSDSFAVDTFPTDYQKYNADSEYGKGTKLRRSTTVYDGSGSSITLTGLKKGTKYFVAIYEYNDNSGNYEYYTSSGYGTVNFTTESITANFTIDDKYQCLSGNVFNFTNTSTNTLGINPSSNSLTYTWNYGENKSTKVVSENSSHTYTVGGIFDVRLTAESVGCKTDTTISDTVVVPWIIDFELDKSISDNDSVQCYGDNYFNILNTSEPPDKPIYGLFDRTRNSWTTDEGTKGTLYDFDFGTDVTGEIRVKLVVGRLVSPGQDYCYDSLEKVYVILPPVIDESKVNISDSILCLSDNEYTFSHSGNNVVATTWDFGDNTSSTMNPATHSYTSAGVYEITCTVTDNIGCTAEITDSVAVVETPNNFFSGLSSIYCEGDPIVTLKPNLPGGTFKGGMVNTIDSTFNPSTPGKYTVGYIYAVGSCVDTFIVETEVLPRPFFSIGKDTIICSGTTIDLRVDSSGLNYDWDDGTTDQTRTVDKEGTYWVEGDNGSCAFSDTVTIVGVTLPIMDLGNDTSICGGEFVKLSIQSDAGSIVWSDGSQEGFDRTVTESGFYVATITHPCGVVTDSINIDILPTACEIFIPNAISPNSDFLNEQFYPLGLFRFISLQVWDEYGQRLFESFTEGKGWDGKVNGEVCQPGTYYYMIRYQLPENGSYVNKMASGPLYIIR